MYRHGRRSRFASSPTLVFVVEFLVEESNINRKVAQQKGQENKTRICPSLDTNPTKKVIMYL